MVHSTVCIPADEHGFAFCIVVRSVLSRSTSWIGHMIPGPGPQFSGLEQPQLNLITLTYGGCLGVPLSGSFHSGVVAKVQSSSPPSPWDQIWLEDRGVHLTHITNRCHTVQFGLHCCFKVAYAMLFDKQTFQSRNKNAGPITTYLIGAYALTWGFSAGGFVASIVDLGAHISSSDQDVM